MSDKNDTGGNASSHSDSGSKTPLDKSQNYPYYEPQELEVKTCPCPNCKHWTTSVDWTIKPMEFEDKETTKFLCENKPIPLLKSKEEASKPVALQEFKNKTGDKVPTKILVHGTTIPHPVHVIGDVYFHESIIASLKRLKYVYSNNLQSFVWPALFRQLNVGVISGPKSGKTMSYLPVVCTFALQNKTKYPELNKHKGPLVVILCSSSKHCEEISDLTRLVLANSLSKCKLTLLTYPRVHVSGTEIVITTPTILLKFLGNRMLNFKRLCTLVMEDTHLLLKNNSDEIYSILKLANEALEHRNFKKSVQLIAVSEKWTTNMEKMLKELHSPPMICIGDSLEAALYGHIKFEVSFIEEHEKNRHLRDLLKDKWNINRTIIICDSTSVKTVSVSLRLKNMKTIPIPDDSSKEDIATKQYEWSSAFYGDYHILICSDYMLNTFITLSEATWLIHYSLPDTWTQFSRRFSVVTSALNSCLNTKQSEILCQSFLMIDNNSGQQLPKILNLMTRLSNNLPLNYEQYLHDLEVKKLNGKVAVCNDLKLFGKCGNAMCKKRHIFDQADVSKELPENGEIKFRVVEIIDVTLYTIQLISHTDLNGHFTKYNSSNYYEPITDEDVVKAENIEIGGFYLHPDTDSSDKLVLCRVLKLDDQSVDVKLYTTEETLQTNVSKLHKLPDNLILIQCHLCNLIPPYNDLTFSAKAFHQTKTIFRCHDDRNMILSGSIMLQMDHALWLDNAMERIQTRNREVINFNVAKELKSREMVEVNENQMLKLRNLCAKCNVPLPNYVKLKPKASGPSKIELVRQEAFLDSDEIQTVYISSAVSPHEIYVRIAKFAKQLSNLEQEIDTAISLQTCPNLTNVIKGSYCLAPNSEEDAYYRALILNFKGDRALCYFVDYGDETQLPISALKKIPVKFIDKLPFQAIQCSLFGLLPESEKWDDKATDLIYSFINEPNSEFFRPLWLKVCSKGDGSCIRTITKYSVILKDPVSNCLINKALIEAGYAMAIEIINDFDVTEVKSNSEKDSEIEEILNDDNGMVKIDPDLIDVELDEDLYDIHITDPEYLLRPMFPEHFANNSVPLTTLEQLQSDNNNVPNNLTQVHNVGETSTALLPDIYWSQTEETVVLKIKVIGVSDCNVKLLKQRVFTFNACLQEKKYNLTLTLRNVVSLRDYFIGGQEVRVVLIKNKPELWDQLTISSKKPRNVHYEFPENEIEEPKKRFLDLNIPDKECDNDKDNEGIIYDISDIDSEYDQDLETESD